MELPGGRVGGATAVRKCPSAERGWEVDVEAIPGGSRAGHCSGGAGVGLACVRHLGRQCSMCRRGWPLGSLHVCVCVSVSLCGRHFSGHEISLWRAWDPLDLVR